MYLSPTDSWDWIQQFHDPLRGHLHLNPSHLSSPFIPLYPKSLSIWFTFYFRKYISVQWKNFNVWKSSLSVLKWCHFRPLRPELCLTGLASVQLMEPHYSREHKLLPETLVFYYPWLGLFRHSESSHWAVWSSSVWSHVGNLLAVVTQDKTCALSATAQQGGTLATMQTQKYFQETLIQI